MFAMHAQITRVRAERMLDAAQAAAYPHLGKGAKEWLDGLIERVQGVVTEARDIAEQLHWNGKVVDIRTFKREWSRHEAQSVKAASRESGRQLVNRLLGWGKR